MNVLSDRPHTLGARAYDVLSDRPHTLGARAYDVLHLYE